MISKLVRALRGKLFVYKAPFRREDLVEVPMKLVSNAHVLLECPNCGDRVPFTDDKPYNGGSLELLDSIREAMVAHRVEGCKK